MGALLEAISGDDNASETVLGENVNLKGFAKAIKQCKVKNIITLAGAGISTSCGIPDFRSPKTGLYHNLQKYDLKNPQDIFTISYFRKNPEPFFTLSKELAPNIDKYKPSITHYFIKLLNDKGLLLRHYTQNIDGLEILAGLHENKCIEAHGHYRTGTCLKCGKKYNDKYFMPKIMNDEIPKCDDKNKCDGLVKPDVVFFGEGLPNKFFDAEAVDFAKCDMLIIMGTSLKVHPFAGLIRRVSKSCPRLLINMQYAAKNTLSEKNRDYFLEGKCDDGIREFAKKLGWLKELEMLRKNGLNENNDDQQEEMKNDDSSNSSTVNFKHSKITSADSLDSEDSYESLLEEKKNENISCLGKTSLFLAAGRAIESEKENGLFNDRFASIFAGKMGYEYLKMMSLKMSATDIDSNGYSKELLKYIVFRTKWIDDRIKKAMNEFKTNKKQIVFLGIGCDTRSLRMECLNNNNNINIFELDLEDIIKYREYILINKCKIEKKENIKSLCVDLRNKEWINILIKNGFNKQYDTIWIVEGLFTYLNINEIDKLFKMISDETNVWNKNDNVKNWIIGTILNSKTILQNRLNKVMENNNMNVMKFEGCSEPHLLLKQYQYNQYDIKPTGGQCKQYDEYLNELQILKQKNNENENNNKFVPDKLAKSFLFLGMK